MDTVQKWLPATSYLQDSNISLLSFKNVSQLFDVAMFFHRIFFNVIKIFSVSPQVYSSQERSSQLMIDSESKEPTFECQKMLCRKTSNFPRSCDVITEQRWSLRRKLFRFYNTITIRLKMSSAKKSIEFDNQKMRCSKIEV